MTDGGFTETELTEGYLAPGAAESPQLAALVDESAILSTEQQGHVADLHEHDSWGVDAATQRFTFTAPDGTTLDCRAHLLGSAAPGPGTWLWGWVNANGFPDAFFARAASVRDTADAPELTTAELPLAPGLPLRLTIAAKTVTGISAHYSAPVGGGTRIWMLIEHPSLELPAPTVFRTMEAVRVTLDSVQLTDHRAAMRAWAGQRGVPVRAAEPDADAAPGGETLAFDLSDGELVVQFDAQHRLARMRAEVEPPRAPEPPADDAPADELPAPEPQRSTAPEEGTDAPKPRGFLSRLLGRG